MLAIFSKIQSLIMALCILLSSLFTIGQLPVKVDMPALEAGELGQWVDPFIGTGGLPWTCAMLFPGPTSPFGMVRLSPDTSSIGGINLMNSGNAGYYYAHDHTFGFSHTRLSGTGARGYGHFRATPAVGNMDPADRLSRPLIFSHENEIATSGYYAVDLPSISCLAELTTSQHTGAHRYTFRTEKDAHLFLDATSFLAPGSAEEGEVTVLADAREIVGQGRIHNGFTGGAGGLKAYFVARFNRPFQSFSTWSNGESVEGRTFAEGNDAGVNLNFGNLQNQAVEMQIGISYVSVENARENLDAEAGTFDEVRAAARTEWEDWLSRIQIETANAEIKTIFYTALYHCMIMPTNYTDVDSSYMGFKNTVGTAEDFTYRTDMSIWDTFRTEHPLLNLIAPEIQRDCLKSLVRMARLGGTLPRWPANSGYTGSMLGSPADMVIAESYLKGITDFEVEEAYEFMKKTSEASYEGIDHRVAVEAYNEYGYVPADVKDKSVSRTLEYAWADASIALLGKALGKSEEEVAVYYNKSMNYKNIFNPETKYFQPRNADGSWVFFLPNFTSYYDEVLPVKISEAYCEGSARQWRWVAVQDTQGLIALFGSEKYFVNELDDFMKDASNSRAALNPGAGYWQGNQHDMHAAYLFNDAGRADLTQEWVRWIMTERHSTDKNGLDGNDDGGTLSAWYVLSAMGIYPVAGTDRYWIGSPNLNKAIADLGDGKTLTVTANNQSAKNIYVQSVTLDGVKLDSPFLTHAQFAAGNSVLEFTMGPNPAVNGGF